MEHPDDAAVAARAEKSCASERLRFCRPAPSALLLGGGEPEAVLVAWRARSAAGFTRKSCDVTTCRADCGASVRTFEV
jgi:hypothetical protein